VSTASVYPVRTGTNMQDAPTTLARSIAAFSIIKFCKNTNKINFIRYSMSFNTCLFLPVDGLPIVLTSNIDGYIPLKFEANQTYYVSCDAASQVAGFSQTTLSNQRTNYKSLERNDMELPLANGSISSPLTADHSDLSRESTTKNKLLSAQNSDSERLRAMILNDKSGNAMRRLQAAVAGDVSAANRLGKQTSLPAEYVPSEEPVKPPRRGVGSKPARCNRPEDTSDGGSSFMDVTAAL